MASTFDFKFNAGDLLQLSRRIESKMRTDFNAALKSVHAEAAQKIQEGMIETLKERVEHTGRHQRGTGYLEMSLRDRRNVSITQKGFGVLKTEWMNRSPAKKYWRRIEEGDQTTFSGYILFTNDMEGGARYGPYTPGESRMRKRENKSGGFYMQEIKNEEPPGYKHTRMPQHAGAYVRGIGPFPEYAFTDGGAAVFRNFNFPQHYGKALAAYGLKLESFVR